jgi:RNA polymerase sigma-70 factor (ECF subfamily)
MSSEPARKGPGRPTEDALTTAAIHGDGDAIAMLWHANRRWVAAVILAHKPGFEDLDDLLQEVAMTFVAKIGTLRDPASLRGWLRSIAVNAARASARAGRHRPQPNGDGMDHHPIEDAADDRPALDDEMHDLLERLKRLPENYREPLLLRAVHGMRSKQVAELLGIPPAAVDTRVARARRMLRECERNANHDRDDVLPAEPAASRARPSSCQRGQ